MTACGNRTLCPMTLLYRSLAIKDSQDTIPKGSASGTGSTRSFREQLPVPVVTGPGSASRTRKLLTQQAPTVGLSGSRRYGVAPVWAAQQTVARMPRMGGLLL